MNGCGAQWCRRTRRGVLAGRVEYTRFIKYCGNLQGGDACGDPIVAAKRECSFYQAFTVDSRVITA